MALTTRIKMALNKGLHRIGYKLDNTARENDDAQRLHFTERNHGFDQGIYSISSIMEKFDYENLERQFSVHRECLRKLKDPSLNETGYAPGNGYFESPDSDIFYLMMRRFEPKMIIEVGSGNSTMVARQAILDGKFPCKLISVDPAPRAHIAELVDQFIRSPVENDTFHVFANLKAGDILFIDSSHEIRAGNDVAHLFCRIIPQLPSGVVIHVHDVFLPYEYPKAFFSANPSWGEQYILHALINGGEYEILWPGYYLQRMRPDITRALPFLNDGTAQSFWIRKR